MKTQPMNTLLVAEWDDRYSSVPGTIANAGGTDLLVERGTIVDDDGGGNYSLQSDDLQTTGGIVKNEVLIPAGGNADVAILTSGPSIVNYGALSTGGTVAGQVPKLEALGIKVLLEPPNIEP